MGKCFGIKKVSASQELWLAGFAGMESWNGGVVGQVDPFAMRFPTRAAADKRARMEREWCHRGETIEVVGLVVGKKS